MLINSSNALIVAQLFAALADERYSMRTLPAIRKASAPTDATQEQLAEVGATLTDAALANVASELGMRLRRRLRDNAILIERPVPAAEALAISAKAQLVVAGTEQPFELDFTPPAPPAADATTVGESLLTDDEGSDDEDSHFIH